MKGFLRTMPALLLVLGPAAPAQIQEKGTLSRNRVLKAASVAPTVQVGADMTWLKNVQLHTADGREFTFREFLPRPKGEEMGQGSLFVISFWSCKCPWSKAWDTALSAIARDYAGQGVRVIGIDSNKTETVKEINRYRKKESIPFPVLIDPGNKLADRFGAKTTPHIFLVNRDGKVVYTGAIDNDARRTLEPGKRQTWLRDALDAVLAGKEVPKTETAPVGCGIQRVSAKVKS
ncbi:MAG: redoxin domain-containing protein [Planctomycetota bacterium]